MAWLLDGGGWSASYADGKILVVFHYRNYILWEEYGDARWTAMHSSHYDYLFGFHENMKKFTLI